MITSITDHTCHICNRLGPARSPPLDQRRRHRSADLLDRDRVQKVVAPGAVDVKIAAQQTFLAKTDLLQYPPACGILRAHSRLYPVQVDRAKTVIEPECERGRRHAPSGGGACGPVANPRGPQRAVRDVPNRQLPAELSVEFDDKRQHPPPASLRPKPRTN